MLKVLAPILIIAILAGPTPAIGKILFYDDCENAPKSEDWKTIIGNMPKGGSISLSSAQKRSGASSYRLMLPRADPDHEYNTAAGDLHVELRLNGHVSSGKQPHTFAYGKDYWIGYSVFIPSDFDPNHSGWFTLGQFHSINDKCDPHGHAQPFKFQVIEDAKSLRLKAIASSDQDRCGNGNDYQSSGISSPLRKGMWNDVVMHIKFEYAKAGINEIWLNGERFLNNTTKPNANNDEVAPDWRIGMYGVLNKSNVVFYDEIRVGDGAGDAISSYNEVAPKGTDVPRPPSDLYIAE